MFSRAIVNKISVANFQTPKTRFQPTLNNNFSFKRTFQTPLSSDLSSEVMKLGRLNHVAIAVPDLAQATSLYRDILGAQCSDVLELPEHGVSTVFVNLGNTKLELLGLLGDKSPIANFLQKNPKGGIHHICIEVKDINKALEHVESKGMVSLDKKPKIGAHGKPVIFLHPKSCNGVLLELEQE